MDIFRNKTFSFSISYSGIVCNDISILLCRAKCEGRRGKKQRSGDHVC